MKKLILVLVVGAAAVWVAVALATPGQGQSNKILAVGTLQDDLAFNTALPSDASGIKWGNTQYSADQLPEFLMRLRNAGVTNLGEWLDLHPLVSAAFGMVPVGLLHQPEIVTQQATFAPGATSGWHTHPGYLTATVMSGSVTRYATDCTSQTFAAGQSFYETGAHTFVVKNPGTRAGGGHGHVRRAGRHADDRVADRRAPADRLQSVSRAGRAAGAATALAALAAAAAVAAFSAPAARADGDPASDYLLAQNVYFPYQAPSQAASAGLDQATAAVYAHGDRVKVALIDTVTDLGAIPSLWGKPDDYAHYLGVELGLWYGGPLLVVMPAGFGIYDGGRSTAAEERCSVASRSTPRPRTTSRGARPRRFSVSRPLARSTRRTSRRRSSPPIPRRRRSAGRRPCTSTCSTTAAAARPSSASTRAESRSRR